ncbi:MAG: OB-fold domain-containing protein [Phycisphaerae bacterium]|nr:OB-fold domain-containing protein [Phycisphaerae bacterium]
MTRATNKVANRRNGATRRKIVRLWRRLPRMGGLCARRCTACNTVNYPAGPVCRKCGGRGLENARVATTGHLATYTLAQHGDGQAPTATGIIECDDGARLLCRLADFAPQRLRVGMRVRLVFRRMAIDTRGVPRYGHKAVPLSPDDHLAGMTE